VRAGGARGRARGKKKRFTTEGNAQSSKKKREKKRVSRRKEGKAKGENHLRIKDVTGEGDCTIRILLSKNESVKAYTRAESMGNRVSAVLREDCDLLIFTEGEGGRGTTKYLKRPPID